MKITYKTNNITEYENALPKKVILERRAEGARLPQCYWDITIKTWKNKNYEGIASDGDVMKLIHDYKEYVNYQRYIPPFTIVEEVKKPSRFIRLMRFIGWLDKKASIVIFPKQKCDK